MVPPVEGREVKRKPKMRKSSMKTTTGGDADVAQALEIDSEVQAMDRNAATRERKARKKAHRKAAKQEPNIQVPANNVAS